MKKRPVGKAYPSMSEEAEAHWIVFAGEYGDLLTREDRPMFRAYCEAWADYEKAKARVESDGVMIMTPNGMAQKSPWMTMVEQRREFIRKVAADLAGRLPRVEEAAQEKPKAPADKFLGRLHQ